MTNDYRAPFAPDGDSGPDANIPAAGCNAAARSSHMRLRAAQHPARLQLTTASRVDLSWCDTRGIEHQRLSDVPIRADAGAVICQQSITWAKASPTATMIARLVAVDGSGGERLLGEYTFNHTRTIPGPPGWELP